MVDPGTGLAILGGGALSKDVVGRMLGPTADYVGEGLRDWTARRTENIQRIFRKAHGRIPPEQLDQPGTVPPRVLKEVLEAGAFTEEDLAAEYLGGILASSRTEGGRDDRAASAAATIGRLSTYAIRTHYIVYAATRGLVAGGDVDFRVQPGGQVFLPTNAYVEAMELSDEERTDYMGIVSHVLLSLSREDLVGSTWSVGSPEHLRSKVSNRDFAEHGLVVTPSQNGIALFAAGHGMRGDVLKAFADPEEEFGFDAAPEVTAASLVSSLPTYTAPVAPA